MPNNQPLLKQPSNLTFLALAVCSILVILLGGGLYLTLLRPTASSPLNKTPQKAAANSDGYYQFGGGEGTNKNQPNFSDPSGGTDSHAVGAEPNIKSATGTIDKIQPGSSTTIIDINTTAGQLELTANSSSRFYTVASGELNDSNLSSFAVGDKIAVGYDVNTRVIKDFAKGDLP